MNATVATAKANKKPLAPAALRVEEIPIEQIAPSAINPRKSIDQAQLAELAASIKAVGIQVPLAVRVSRWDDTAQIYELVGGERRWRAAQLAGLKTVPAVVRELTDAEVADAALIENLQREDLPPLEEADAYAGMATSHSPAAIAARVGKTVEYVTRRLKLRTLVEPCRQSLAERLITLDHALLLAKLAPAEQEKTLRYVLGDYRQNRTTEAVIAEAIRQRADQADTGDYWEPRSAVRLKAFIEEEINLALAGAPWNLTDAHLVESAGACATCPSNTAANTALFGDLAIKDASCMDAECFAAKKKAFVQIQAAEIAAAGKDAIRISWKASGTKPKLIDGCVAADQVFKAGQWIEAKEGECGFSGPGIAVDEDQYNSAKKLAAKLRVCVAAGCKRHPKAWEQAPAKTKAKAAANRSSYDPKAEEEKRKQRAEAIAAENSIRRALAKTALEKVKKLSPELLRIILRVMIATLDLPQAVEHDLTSAPIDGLVFARAVAAAALQASGLEVASYQQPDAARGVFLATLKILGVDGKPAWSKKPAPKPSKVSPAAAKTAPVTPAGAAAIHKLHPKARAKRAKKGGKK